MRSYEVFFSASSHLVVPVAEQVVPEALRDGGAHPQDLGDVLAADHHVPVVQLHVYVGLLVQQVVGAACWRQADQLPEVAVQLVTPRRLQTDRRGIYTTHV